MDGYDFIILLIIINSMGCLEILYEYNWSRLKIELMLNPMVADMRVWHSHQLYRIHNKLHLMKSQTAQNKYKPLEWNSMSYFNRSWFYHKTKHVINNMMSAYW